MKYTKEQQFKTLVEPFRIKMVEPIHPTTAEYRWGKLKSAGFNPFLLDSDDVFIDLLTDSGTSAMSQDQWAAMLRADESYAGSSSWMNFEEALQDLSGMPYVLPTHQGRAGERILYGILGGSDKTFISNTHFDTTRANIENTGAEAIDLVVAENADFNSEAPFKGNLDVAAARNLIRKKGKSSIAALIMTVTNNSAGGQPVSMENLYQARELCNEFDLLLVLDGCRIAENSYFIHHREKGYNNKTYKEIAQEILGLADVFMMSAKKDAIANSGGLLCMHDKALKEECTQQLIITEGFTTYGGLSGRDMEAVAVGIREVFEPAYLEYRIRSTTYLGAELRKAGIPVVWPIGGHAVYLDAASFYPQIPIDEYPGQVLVCALYLEGGVRSVEVGSLMFGKYDEDGRLIPAPNELVRLAIPRRVYTQSHIDYVVESVLAAAKQADQRSGLRIISEPKFLRHFTARFEEKK